MTAADARAAAARIVGRVDRGGAYSNVVSRTETKGMNPSDVGVARGLAYDTLRSLPQIDAEISANSRRPLDRIDAGLLDLIRVGVAEIARDKAYRKLADRYCFEELGVAYNELEDEAKKSAIDARVRQEKGGLPGSAMVSDAFFPFRDGVMVGIREGVKAVVQPGGALNDWNVIEACNEAGVTMVFTGQRSFKH